jgi:hypothetical protein
LILGEFTFLSSLYILVSVPCLMYIFSKYTSDCQIFSPTLWVVSSV